MPPLPYAIKGHWQGLLGRTIEAVVVVAHETLQPRQRVFLLFADGNYFEIYSGCGDIAGTKRLTRGNICDVLHWQRLDAEVVVHHVDYSEISREHAEHIAVGGSRP
ncbi:MAG TPA: hypothetical protein VGA37_08870 [Gemmatimonadales bacterium]